MLNVAIMYERQTSRSEVDDQSADWLRVFFICLMVVLWALFVALVVLHFVCESCNRNIMIPSIVVSGALSGFCTGVVCLNWNCRSDYDM